MKAVMFVNGGEEIDRVINMMTKTEHLDFDFKVVDSVDFLTNQFEKETVDIFICQMGLAYCDALELFQLARMYNPDIINIATGDNKCIEELVKTFNTENLFRFITMPWLNKDDIIGPIRDAIASTHQKVQREYDIKIMEEDGVGLKSKIDKLTEKDEFYEQLFADSREILRQMLLQNYSASSIQAQEEEMDFALYVYDRYLEYFYNNIKELNPCLKELMDKYREPTQGKFFSIRHNITETLPDEIKARVLFNIAILNEFISIYCKSYKVNAVLGKTDNFYLLKYDYILPEKAPKKIVDSKDSYNYKMLEFYIRACSKRCNMVFSEKGLECKIIIA